MRKTITKESIQNLINLGMTTKEISLNLNICTRTLQTRLKEFDLKTQWSKNVEEKYKRYSDIQLIDAFNKADSLNSFFKTLSVQRTGGAFYHYRKRLLGLNLDVNKWSTGTGFKRGGEKTARLRNDQAIKQKIRLRRNCLKKFMDLNSIDEKCDGCGIFNWKGKKLKLHIHHKDHDKTHNDDINNLQYLCPNCHSIEHYNSE